MPKKLISIISPAFNKEGNIRRCREAVRAIMGPMSNRHHYEHIFDDNRGIVGTRDSLKKITTKDRRMKMRSHFRNRFAEKNFQTLLHQCSGEATFLILSEILPITQSQTEVEIHDQSQDEAKTKKCRKGSASYDLDTSRGKTIPWSQSFRDSQV